MDIMDDNVMENRLGLGENIMENIACLHIRRVLAVLYFVVYILVLSKCRVCSRKLSYVN